MKKKNQNQEEVKSMPTDTGEQLFRTNQVFTEKLPNESAGFMEDINKSLNSEELNFDKLIETTEKLSDFTQSGGQVIGKALKEVYSEDCKEAQEVRPVCPLKRNNCGLLEGIEYKYREDGFIDWRAMVKPEYLFVNGSDAKQKERMEKKYGKKFYEINILEDKVVDADLLIGLAGLKELLRLRGYKSVTFRNDYISEYLISKTCCINYIGNYETGGRHNDQVFESCADATMDNVFSWYKKYLTTAAENRALARNIRNFLNIHICSKEEIGADTKEEDSNEINISPVNPHSVLAKKLEEKNTTFEKAKERCIKAGIYTNPEKWNSISDIPVGDVSKILEGIKVKENKEISQSQDS